MDDIESRTRWRAAIKFCSNARDAIRSSRGLHVFVEGLVDCVASTRGSADLLVTVLPPSSFGLRDAASTVGSGEASLSRFAEWYGTETLLSLVCTT